MAEKVVQGIPEAIANLKRWQIIKVQAVKDRLKKQAFKVELLAKQTCPVKTGRLRASISTNWSGSGMSEGKIGAKAKAGDGIKRPDGPEGLVCVVGTNVKYACVVGSRQQIYEPIKKTSANIGNYPFDFILSKDGKAHKIIKKHRFYANLLSAMSIRTRIGRHPLVVTPGHLILIQRDQSILWERAINIKYSDFVFGKRSHNYANDMNKTSYICSCGKEFLVENHELKHRTPKYCSLECRHKYGRHDLNTGMKWNLPEEKKRYGRSNPQWRGGYTKIRYPAEFNERLKNIIKERDKYGCQYCGSIINLIVHHIDGNKFNNDINNLITLCTSCHGKLNKLECELPSLNINAFIPKSILDIRQIEYHRKKKERIPYLYDFTIENENSYVASGILIHNSYVEHGTSKMSAQPYLFPAYFSYEGETILALAKIMKEEVKLG